MVHLYGKVGTHKCAYHAGGTFPFRIGLGIMISMTVE